MSGSGVDERLPAGCFPASASLLSAMAINRDAFELLCWARSEGGCSWDRVLTLGRQSVILPRWELDGWRNSGTQQGHGI